MAGSRKWFMYYTDARDEFAIQMDESNGELVGNADVDGTIPEYAVPRNIEPRFVLYTSDDRRIQRRIPVSNQIQFADDRFTPAVITYPLTNPQTGAVTGTLPLRRTGRVPERQVVVTSSDTGLNDGDFT